MRTSVALLSCIVIGLSMISGNCAKADETIWRIVTPFPDNTKPQNALTKKAREVRRSSDGRIKLQFVGTPVNTNTSVMQRFESDPTLSAALLSNFDYARLVPDANLYSQSFLFDDAKELRAIRSKLDAALIAQLQHDHYVAVGISGIGFAHLMAEDRIRTVDELAGKTVWLPGAASMAALDLAELSLTVETEDTRSRESKSTNADTTLMVHAPIALILDKKIPRFRYLLQPPIHYGYLVFLVKRSAWESLHAEDRGLIQDHLHSHLQEVEKNAARATARATRVLSRGGMQSIRFPIADIDDLRNDSADIGITTSLQSQLMRALWEYRSATEVQ